MKGVEFSIPFRTNVTIKEIVAEIAEAREKFPGPDMTFPALVEEVGEVGQALMEHQRGGMNKKTGKPFTAEDVFNECIQVATMAIRLATEGDKTMPRYKFPFDDLNKARR